MSSFTEAKFELTGELRKGRPLVRYPDGFRFDIGREGSGLAVVIAPGFESDGPSIPAWLFRIPGVRKLFARIAKSAAVHDCLRQDLRFTKLEGDAIFLTAMAAEGAPAWLRESAFLAVRFNNSRARATDPSNLPQTPS